MLFIKGSISPGPPPLFLSSHLSPLSPSPSSVPLLSLLFPPLLPVRSLSVPLPSLSRSGPLNPAKGSGGVLRAPSAGFGAQPRPQKHFEYICAQEIMSRGNGFGTDPTDILKFGFESRLSL